jgi:hypothetical protein
VQTDLSHPYEQTGAHKGHSVAATQWVVQIGLQTFLRIGGSLILGARQLPHVAPSSTRVIKIRVTITTVNFILPTKRTLSIELIVLLTI